MAAPTLALTACMSASTPAGCEECAIGPYSTDASRDVPTLNDLADVSPRDFAFLETSKDVQKMFTGNVLPFALQALFGRPVPDSEYAVDLAHVPRYTTCDTPLRRLAASIVRCKHHDKHIQGWR